MNKIAFGSIHLLILAIYLSAIGFIYLGGLSAIVSLIMGIIFMARKSAYNDRLK